MGLAIEQSFRLEAPRSLVWALLIDPQKIVGCLPGAAITAKLDDRTYEGTMTLKVGPVAAIYKGKVRFERVDATAGETELAGQGQETKGKGSAEMRMRCRVQGAGAATQVTVKSDVAVTGILAQFGRGMIQEVADRMLQQFTTQMRAVLERAKASIRSSCRPTPRSSAGSTPPSSKSCRGRPASASRRMAPTPRPRRRTWRATSRP